MFMLIWNPNSGLVSKQVRLAAPESTRRHNPMRSQRHWMEKMHLETLGWKSRFYAFRHCGRWHLCDALAKHEPLRSIDGDARPGAEMWVMNRERQARDAACS